MSTAAVSRASSPPPGPDTLESSTSAMAMNELVEVLKGECLEAKNHPLKCNEMKWILTAVGISLLVLGGGFLGAAFAISSLLLGQIGISLLVASTLSLAAIPLFTPTDYDEVAEMVNKELIEYAYEEKITLEPGNIVLESKVKELIEKRKAEEEKEADRTTT